MYPIIQVHCFVVSQWFGGIEYAWLRLRVMPVLNGLEG